MSASPRSSARDDKVQDDAERNDEQDCVHGRVAVMLIAGEAKEALRREEVGSVLAQEPRSG